MEFTPVTEEKRCPKCSETKPAAAFGRDKSCKGGLRTWCKACSSTANAAWQRANREKVAASKAAYRAANREKINARAAAWQRANREKINARAAAWQRANPEKNAAYRGAYRAANKPACNAQNRARKAQKLQAIPGWANKAAVARIYAKAQEWSAILGVELHVDHVVPLQSKLVCGLHTHDNLQLLEKRDNNRKGNRTWPEA